MPQANLRRRARERSGVFISYARDDGEAFATELRRRLKAEGIPLFHDRASLEGGKDWWLQIEDALNQVQFMAMVMTPNAIQSKVVRKEWRYARQQGVCVYPINAVADDLDFDSLPRWMRDMHFYDIEHEWEKLLSDLTRTPDTPRVPFMVSDMSDDFVDRFDESDQIIHILYNENLEEPIAGTVALCGTGGFGKTTLAAAVCHDERIQNAFDDGILWVKLSKVPGNLTGHVEALITQLSDDSPGLPNLEAAITRFRDLIEERDILIVIDDLWDNAHLRPFIQGGKRCARLITTRNLDALPDNVTRVKVATMKESEATALLAGGFGDDPDLQLVADDLNELAHRVGEYPLLLKLVNGFLRKSSENENRSLPDSITKARQALERRGVTFFDVLNTEARNRAVKNTIGVSLELLEDQEKERFLELAAFPENVDIPLSTVQRLWLRTGSVNEFDAEDLCVRLNRLSLLLDFNAPTRRIRVHKVIRDYLCEQSKARLSLVHGELLDAYDDLVNHGQWALLPESEGYLWDHLSFHLIEARRFDELLATVKDWRYIAKKTLFRKSLSMEADLRRAEESGPADLIVRALRRTFANSGHLLNHCQTIDELEETLLLRLQHLREVTPLLEDLRLNLRSPRIESTSDLPDRPHPALVRTLEGHLAPVWGCALGPGAVTVSVSADDTLKVWNTDSGEAMRTLKEDRAHAPITSFAISPNGRQIVAGLLDGTLTVWDARSGEIVRRIVGPGESVTNLSFIPNSNLVVLTSDRSVMVRDIESGNLLMTLEGHSRPVNDLAVSVDGSLMVSASDDGTLKVWDRNQRETGHLPEVRSEVVNCCAFSSDGALVVTASDQMLRLWNASSGETQSLLEGHSGTVRACAFSPDGQRIVSASDDYTLRVWEVNSGRILQTLEGHMGSVLRCSYSSDGKHIVSSSADRTIKVWVAESNQVQVSVEAHSDAVWGCRFSPDRSQIISAADDGTLKVWNACSGELLRVLDGHESSINDCAVSAELIVSASSDRTLRVWHAQTGDLLRALEGHLDAVRGCEFDSDSKLIVSASQDQTVKVWDAHSGDLLSTFYADGEMYCCAMSSRRIAAGGARGMYFLTFVGGLRPARNQNQDVQEVVS